MKKSMLMLTALFMLGACSVTPNSDWEALVGGKTAYVGASTLGTFSNDATTFDAGGEKFDIKKSTANSATYKGSMQGYDVTFNFSDVSANGGKYDTGEGSIAFTWSATE